MPRKVKNKAVDQSRVNEHLINLLSRQDYTEKALRLKLKKNFPENPEFHEPAIEYAQIYYPIDDLAFGQRFLENQLREGVGKNKIKQRMYNRHFPREVIDTVLSSEEADQHDYLSDAIRLREAKFGTEPFSDIKAKAKAQRFLVGKGFSFDVVNQAINHRYDDDEA